MKYILNKLHEKTTNNFKINNLEIDLDIPNYKGFDELQIIGDSKLLKIEKNHKKEKLNTKIGLEIKEYEEIKITIPKNIKIDDPVIIDYAFKNDDSFYDKIIFNYEENSKCDFYITYISADETSHFHHLLEKTRSEKNSEGSITYLNMMNKNSINMIAIENDVLEDANITHNIIDIGGNIRLYNMYSNLLEKKAQNNLNTIYIGKKDNLIDMNFYLKNIAKETTNRMQVEGLLDDSSKKNFRGIIDFQKGCAASIGEENENCILLSDNARSRSLPELLCGEEDVVGSHGVSSGKVSQDKLFYLMSRGYEKKEAEKLIVMTNFSKILNTISYEDFRDYIKKNIDDLLS